MTVHVFFYMGQTATKPDKVNIWSCAVKEADVAGKWTNLADKGPFQFCLLLENCFAKFGQTRNNNKQQTRNEGSDYWFLLFAPSSLFFLLRHLFFTYLAFFPLITFYNCNCCNKSCQIWTSEKKQLCRRLLLTYYCWFIACSKFGIQQQATSRIEKGQNFWWGLVVVTQQWLMHSHGLNFSSSFRSMYGKYNNN